MNSFPSSPRLVKSIGVDPTNVLTAVKSQYSRFRKIVGWGASAAGGFPSVGDWRLSA